MRYFDLHCDSVAKAYSEKTSLFGDNLAVKIGSDKFIKREQCFALWLGDGLSGEPAFSYCKKLLEFYKANEDEIKNRGVTPYLTLENASSLGDDLNNIAYFRRQGTAMMSLTWNGKNSLASGVNASGGLTQLGEAAVKEAENCGIIIDVSHLNEESFRGVCKTAKKPFVASHSCLYDICPHRRNLKRWQAKEIIDRGGLIGINFYPLFLGKGSVFERIRDNIEYLLALGGENCIALGSDFDGADMAAELSSVEDTAELRDYLSAYISVDILDKIFYGNAERVMRKGE